MNVAPIARQFKVVTAPTDYRTTTSSETWRPHLDELLRLEARGQNEKIVLVDETVKRSSARSGVETELIRRGLGKTYGVSAVVYRGHPGEYLLFLNHRGVPVSRLKTLHRRQRQSAPELPLGPSEEVKEALRIIDSIREKLVACSK
jgi:hypothetical protein